MQTISTLKIHRMLIIFIMLIKIIIMLKQKQHRNSKPPIMGSIDNLFLKRQLINNSFMIVFFVVKSRLWRQLFIYLYIYELIIEQKYMEVLKIFRKRINGKDTSIFNKAWHKNLLRHAKTPKMWLWDIFCKSNL